MTLERQAANRTRFHTAPRTCQLGSSQVFIALLHLLVFSSCFSASTDRCCIIIVSVGRGVFIRGRSILLKLLLMDEYMSRVGSGVLGNSRHMEQIGYQVRCLDPGPRAPPKLGVRARDISTTKAEEVSNTPSTCIIKCHVPIRAALIKTRWVSLAY